MSEAVIVIVSDLDDAKHGEINVVENLQKAARLVFESSQARSWICASATGPSLPS
jgi:hypothetical protein